MIKKLAQKISTAIASSSDAQSNVESREKAIHMATAVLMTEVARADYEYDESEFNLLLDLITTHFHITPEVASELANEAGDSVEDYVSIHSLTKLLNENLSRHERERIVYLLWQIAFADGRLDRYEDSVVSKISALLYVSRGRVMQLKHEARPPEPLTPTHG